MKECECSARDRDKQYLIFCPRQDESGDLVFLELGQPSIGHIVCKNRRKML